MLRRVPLPSGQKKIPGIPWCLPLVCLVVCGCSLSPAEPVGGYLYGHSPWPAPLDDGSVRGDDAPPSSPLFSVRSSRSPKTGRREEEVRDQEENVIAQTAYYGRRAGRKYKVRTA